MARYGLIRFDCKRHFAQEDFKTNMHWKLKSLIRLWIVSSAGERLGGWDLYGDVATQRLRDCFCFLVLLGSLHSRQNLWCWLKLHTNEIEIIVLFLSTFWIIMNLLRTFSIPHRWHNFECLKSVNSQNVKRTVFCYYHINRLSLFQRFSSLERFLFYCFLLKSHMYSSVPF